MKNIEKVLKKHKSIIFMDFEGTQFSHEMIALGAVVCTLDKKYRIKKMKEPFRIYVKAKNKIGRYVTQLTGITEEQLIKDGVSFEKAMKAFKKYCGIAFTRSSFMTFGNHDLRILNQSIMYNTNAPGDICSQIQRNYIDFLPIISEFIRDANYNPMSLIHYLELFGIKESGTAHDPEYDAINLANLYNAFLTNKELVLSEYLRLLPKSNNLPSPIKRIINQLADGHDVTVDDYKTFLKEYLEQ